MLTVKERRPSLNVWWVTYQEVVETWAATTNVMDHDAENKPVKKVIFTPSLLLHLIRG